MDTIISLFNNPAFSFIKFAVYAGILASFSFGIVGSYIVIKRISYIAGAISHCVLGGIGFAIFMQSRFHMPWFTPYTGALIAAISASIIIFLAEEYSKERLDSMLGAIWSIGMASGIIFIYLTPGYIDPMSYLFGNILLVSDSDIWLIGISSAIVLILNAMLQKKLLAVSFDEEFLLVRGMNTGKYKLILFIMAAITIVLMIRIVGIIMIIALLSIPPAIASKLFNRFTLISISAVFINILCILSGIGFSFKYNLPSGPAIILCAGLFYIIVVLFKSRTYSKLFNYLKGSNKN